MVNITDIKEIEHFNLQDVDLLEILLDKQKELMNKYQIFPVGEDIDTLRGSQLIRSFSKYTVEELAEAYEAYLVEKEMGLHFWEEVIDSLHFLLEKVLVSKLNYKKVFYYMEIDWKKFENFQEMNLYIQKQYPKIKLEEGLRWISYYVNISDNFIRNKERKKAQIPTNRKDFYRSVANSVYYFFYFTIGMWADPKFLLKTYLQKNKVNHFRIKSKY